MPVQVPLRPRRMLSGLYLHPPAAAGLRVPLALKVNLLEAQAATLRPAMQALDLRLPVTEAATVGFVTTLPSGDCPDPAAAGAGRQPGWPHHGVQAQADVSVRAGHSVAGLTVW